MTSLSNQRQIRITKVDMRSPKSDALFWHTQPYTARLAALESIRQEFVGWKYGAKPRFQRVYTIVKR
ncbi:hypothetical protein [Coleofasciculus sp. E1-EBD-02]|jgi:hypothetical protein|uniref:hypothetical protein n=1 Tax=Coleofasciculus sp. E1-EBD-02 TaxID=3068481 RepID=UPI0032F1783A